MEEYTSLTEFEKRNVLVTKVRGRVGDEIEQYRDIENNTYCYLKRAKKKVAVQNIDDEYIRLNELEKIDSINVPKVLFYSKEPNETVVILSEIEGIPAHECENPELAVKCAALALKEIHLLAPDNNKVFGNIQKRELKNLRYMVENGKINWNNFEKNNQGENPRKVLDYLIETEPILENRYFTHGDFCLPNVILNGEKYGIIDWGQAGIGDRHRDFSSIIGSITRNFGFQFVKKFFEYYGINFDEIDMRKVEYYKKIDQFYYNLKNETS